MIKRKIKEQYEADLEAEETETRQVLFDCQSQEPRQKSGMLPSTHCDIEAHVHE